MEIHELAHQEDVAQVTAATLERGLSALHGSQFQVQSSGGAQEWAMTRTLSTFFTKGVSSAGRRFMKDRFRFSPRIIRTPFQWTLGSVLGSSVILRWAPIAFTMTPSLPNATDTLVVPGSRRVRVFDFADKTTHSFLKVGYPDTSIRNEIEVRHDFEAPSIPLVGFDPQMLWFKEPIVVGYPLPRCPPWWNKNQIVRQAIDALVRWSAISIQETDSATYFAGVLASIQNSLVNVNDKYPGKAPVGLSELLNQLTQIACSSDRSMTVLTHGDLQPGNIHVERGHRRVFTIDWEYSDRREIHYDLLTFGLRARYTSGLALRVTEFIRSGKLGLAERYTKELSNPTSRRQAAAAFLLHDLDRVLKDAAVNPYLALPLGSEVLLRECAALDGVLF